MFAIFHPSLILHPSASFLSSFIPCILHSHLSSFCFIPFILHSFHPSFFSFFIPFILHSLHPSLPSFILLLHPSFLSSFIPFIFLLSVFYSTGEFMNSRDKTRQLDEAIWVQQFGVQSEGKQETKQ